MSEVLVGLAGEVPVGSLIAPCFESQSNNGVPDLFAARGIVRGIRAANPRFAAFRVMRDVVRRQLPDGGYGGAMATHWDPGASGFFLGASEYAKNIIIRHALRNDGTVGYLHSVEEDRFEDQSPATSPDGLRSVVPARVVGSRALTLDELADHFGPNLEALPDPLENAAVARDIRAIYASGVLVMAHHIDVNSLTIR